MEGSISLPRSIVERSWANSPVTMYVFIRLVLKANWKESTWLGSPVARGELVTSIAGLSKEFGIKDSQTRYALKCLREDKRIACVSTSQFTKITICDYDSYQFSRKTDYQTEVQTEVQAEVQTNCERSSNIRIKEEKDKGTKKKTSTDVKESLTFPFSSDAFMLTWGKLVKEPKWKSKTVNALQLSLNKLSRYDERFAIKLMEDAIEHGWQGVVFKDTDAQYAEWMAANPPMPKQQEEEPTIQFNTSPWEHGVFYTLADFQATEEGRKLLESFRGEWMETVLEEEGGLLRFRTIWEPLSDHPEFAEQNKGKLK